VLQYAVSAVRSDPRLRRRGRPNVGRGDFGSRGLDQVLGHTELDELVVPAVGAANQIDAHGTEEQPAHELLRVWTVHASGVDGSRHQMRYVVDRATHLSRLRRASMSVSAQ
jgi:hypothetical protein